MQPPFDPPIAPFTLDGPRPPQRPVVVSVPHAGRHYPPSLLAGARVPQVHLQRLEDRFVDLLSGLALDAGFTVVTAPLARAFIDLNRGEEDWDSAVVADARQSRSASTLVRGGLGLVPTRLHPVGDLWHRRISKAELDRRIALVHRPYHGAIAVLLTGAARQFGRAVLLDLHSMPVQAPGAAQLVIGDRYGMSASSQLTDRLIAAAEGFGLNCARNIPYAGAFAISHHARRAQGIEAVQVEIDRSLYLHADGQPDPIGIERLSRVVRTLAEVAQACVSGAGDFPIAAE